MPRYPIDPGYWRRSRRARPTSGSPRGIWLLLLAVAMLLVVFGARALPFGAGRVAGTSTVPPLSPPTADTSATGIPPTAARSIVLPPTSAGATPTPAVVESRDGSSEGVRTTGADRWHGAGFTGRGTKVGVIEWAFNGTDAYLRGATFTVRSFRPDGMAAVTDDAELPYGQWHGIATAEIVHEMAPDAELVLAIITREPASFVTAVDWLASAARVDVISFSGGWYSGYAKDGTSPMAQAVDRAKAAGVFVALSGGNRGGGSLGSNDEEGHYRAMFTDADGDGYHDFAPAGGRILNGQTIRVAGGVLRIQLDWEGYRNPQALYSVELTDASGNRAAWSDPARTADTGAPYQNLEESMPGGVYALRIKKETRDAADLPVEVFFNGAQFSQVTPEGSLNLPADARGAVAVGAANWRTGEVEDFASRGPTRDGRAKPDIYGPDCTTSRVYSTFGGQFCGASAATPHVAGAAALVKGAFPGASPDEVLRWLRAYGKPLADGAVRVDLGPLPPRG
jgi:hypothetical protein